MSTQVDGLHGLPCRIFVVIRNGINSFVMCEFDLYGWMVFLGGFTFEIKTWYIFVMYVVCTS